MKKGIASTLDIVRMFAIFQKGTARFGFISLIGVIVLLSGETLNIDRIWIISLEV